MTCDLLVWFGGGRAAALEEVPVDLWLASVWEAVEPQCCRQLAVDL